MERMLWHEYVPGLLFFVAYITNTEALAALGVFCALGAIFSLVGYCC